jgi:hypothetical protein
MIRKVWIIVGSVTEPDSLHFGEPEYQFSDGPFGRRGDSANYVSLQKGLQDHSGCVIHWAGKRVYTVKVQVRETRTIVGTIKVFANSRDQAVQSALTASDLEHFCENGLICFEQKIEDAFGAIETE